MYAHTHIYIYTYISQHVDPPNINALCMGGVYIRTRVYLFVNIETYICISTYIYMCVYMCQSCD